MVHPTGATRWPRDAPHRPRPRLHCFSSVGARSRLRAASNMAPIRSSSEMASLLCGAFTTPWNNRHLPGAIAQQCGSGVTHRAIRRCSGARCNRGRVFLWRLGIHDFAWQSRWGTPLLLRWAGRTWITRTRTIESGKSWASSWWTPSNIPNNGALPPRCAAVWKKNGRTCFLLIERDSREPRDSRRPRRFRRRNGEGARAGLRL